MACADTNSRTADVSDSSYEVALLVIKVPLVSQPAGSADFCGVTERSPLTVFTTSFTFLLYSGVLRVYVLLRSTNFLPDLLTIPKIFAIVTSNSTRVYIGLIAPVLLS
jgi:hypothetical protein